MSAIRELRVLWLTLALLVVADFVVEATARTRSKRSSIQPMVDQGTTPARADVLLLGSSRMRPLLADEVSAAAGGATTINLAFNGGGFEGQWSMVERHLTPAVLEASGTRLIVLGSSVVDLNDGYSNAGLAAATWTPADFVAHWFSAGTDAQTRAWLYAHPPCNWSALLRARRKSRIRGVVSSFARRVQATLLGTGRPTPKPKPTTPVDEVVEGVVNNATALKSKHASRLADVPPPTGSPYLAGFRVGGKHVAALREMARYLKAHDVRLAVVHTPVSDWYRNVYRNGELDRYVEALLAAAQAEDFALYLLPPGAHGLEDDDYFRAERAFDGHHLVRRTGRVAFSRSLARQVVTPLLAKPAVTFSDSRIEPLR